MTIPRGTADRQASANLTHDDRQMFARLGIDDKLLAQAGVLRVTDRQAREEYGFRFDAHHQARLDGLVFPYLDPRSGEWVTSRLRRDFPERDQQGKAQNKYISAWGDHRHLYFPPGAAEYLADESIPVVIVESEKAALSLTGVCRKTGERYLPVATGGCWGWRGKIGKDENGQPVTGPVPDLNLLGGKGRKDIVAFDANVLRNGKVEAARRALAKELSSREARPYFVSLPRMREVNGPDDFVAVAGAGAMVALLEAAEPFAGEGIGDWRELFHTYQEFLDAPPLTFAIDGFLQNDAATVVAALSGHAKTWVLLAIAKALLSGKGTKFWNHFDVLETAERVVYLIPESTIGPFGHRLQLMGLMEYVQSGRLLVRTLSKGPRPSLADARLLEAVRGAHVMLDTLVRFSEASDENSAGEFQLLASQILALLAAGARTVTAAHHSPKAFESATVMTLENMLRGTGDIGAIFATGWGLKQLDADTNLIHVENIKPRDFQPCGPFQLLGRPSIDEMGDFQMHKPPGECGPLAEEHQPRSKGGGAPQQARESKALRVELLRQWLAAEPDLDWRAIQAKFDAMGIRVTHGLIRKYKMEAAQ
jgi:hypothetical protein